MILDLILLAIVLVLTIIGVMRGIFRTLFHLASVVVAVFAACALSGVIAQFVYDTYIAPTVLQSVNDTLAASGHSVGEIAENVLTSLPAALGGMLSLFGVTEDTLANSLEGISKNTEGLAEALSSAISAPVLSVLSTVFAVLLFLVLVLIFRLIGTRLMGFLERLPVLGVLNRILGGALGVCEGAALCVLLIFVLRLMLPYQTGGLITEEMINESVVFKTIYMSNLF